MDTNSKLQPASESNAQSGTSLLEERSSDLLKHAAAERGMAEDMALALLAHRDLPNEVIAVLAKNGSALKHRSVLNAIVAHPRAPRQVSLPILRRLFTFELMKIALTPTIFADIKMFAEEVLISRLESTSAGERLSLAKQGSTRIAAALLLDPEARVMEAALRNPKMTEDCIVRALMKNEASQALVDLVCRHRKWSLRREIQIALLRNEKTPMARALTFAQNLPSMRLREILRTSRLAPQVREYLLKMLQERPRGLAD